MKVEKRSYLYAAWDLAGSMAAWALFCMIRDRAGAAEIPVTSSQFITGLIVMPAAWLTVYLFSGFYLVSLKRSRLLELGYSLLSTFTVSIIIFLLLIIKGFITEASLFTGMFLALFGLQFILTYIPRVIITSVIASRVHSGKLGYNTIIIGSNGLAWDVYKRIRDEKIPSGSIIRGYVSVSGKESGLFGNQVEHLGRIDDLPAIIEKHSVEEAIIAIEGNEHEMTGLITGMLYSSDITIKAIPSLKDILTGRVEHTSIYGTPFLEISDRLMPLWQANVKQGIDYLFALIFLVILSPVIAVLAVIIKMEDGGPVIYSQERIGKNGKPFTIYKLRSMRCDAEGGEPMLSSVNDERVTKTGRFMRRHRLDEIPNLVNVLRGEMSLVGPRPERPFYIERITEKAPHYRRLLKVKPGITSWGQVKYGYATNVDQMIERLEYDLLYLENMSLLVDLRIIIYTSFIILNGRGM